MRLILEILRYHDRVSWQEWQYRMMNQWQYRFMEVSWCPKKAVKLNQWLQKVCTEFCCVVLLWLYYGFRVVLMYFIYPRSLGLLHQCWLPQCQWYSLERFWNQTSQTMNYVLYYGDIGINFQCLFEHSFVSRTICLFVYIVCYCLNTWVLWVE